MPGTDDADLTALVHRCRELVDIPSVSHNEAEVEAYVRGALPMSLETAVDDDSVLFVRRPRRKGAPLLIIAGHTDTVPIQHNLPSRLEDGVIHGRGTSDMKGGVAVMVELARWMEDNSIQSSYDIGFLFFGREELAAEHCPLLRTIENNDELRGATFGILMEPTANAIEAGCQGNINLMLEFAGEAAHTARPWKGVNASTVAINALQEIANAEPNEVEVDGLLFKEVVTITGFKSGIAKNVVPPSAEVEVNIRYAPSNTPQDVERKWIDYFESRGAKVTVGGHARPAPVVIHHSVVETLRENGAGDPMPKQAWTNAADFAAFDIPAVNFGPGDPYFAHRQDEQIECDALLTSFRTLQRLVSA